MNQPAPCTTTLPPGQQKGTNSMSYERLDNEELLRLSLDAMNTSRDAESMVMLKTLLDREPEHAHGQYLLAAQHAQMGLMDRAEAGFRAAVRTAGANFPMPRFQLGQLLLLKGAHDEARQVLAPLQNGPDAALSAYAAALSALASEDLAAAVPSLQTGLEQPQAVPALAEDMRRLLAKLQDKLAEQEAESATPAGASLLLSNYGRHN
jgi:hypothetical protein